MKAEVVEREIARLNLSHNRFAAAIGLSSGFMSQLLAGDRDPSPESRARIQALLRIDDWDALWEFVD